MRQFLTVSLPNSVKFIGIFSKLRIALGSSSDCRT